MMRVLALVALVALFGCATARDLRSKVKRDDPVDTIKVCYFCDWTCQSRIAATGTNYTVFFDTLTEKADAILESLNEDVHLKKKLIIAPSSSIRMYWYDEGTYNLADVNTVFWNAHDLFGLARQHGCNYGYLMASDGQFMSKVDIAGIAVMHSVCGPRSYSTIELMENNINMQAVILTHELGHALGMYHDGKYPASMQSVIDAYPVLGKQITDNCVTGVCDGGCIMQASGNANMKEFSDCSKAYLDVLRALGQDYYFAYKVNDCVAHDPHAPEEKRELAVRGADDEDVSPELDLAKVVVASDAVAADADVRDVADSDFSDAVDQADTPE